MANILLSTLIAVIATAPVPAPQEKAVAGVGYALLIGVDRYASESLSPLAGSRNDLLAIRRVLTSRHGFAEERVRVLADDEATRRNILDAMRSVIETAGENDTVYIHFSGYGSQVKDQSGDEKDDGLDETIVPHDGRTDGVADITDDELGEILDARKSRNVVLVLDSSHAGTGTRGATVVRDRSAPPDARLELYERPARRDVKPLEESYVLLGAAAAGQAALDVRVDGRVHGLFSYCLARSLLRSPPTVTPRQLFAGIKLELRRIQEQLGRRSMPRPQLELHWDRLDEPLFGVFAGAPTGLAVEPLSAHEVLVKGGAEMLGVEGSYWALYAADEPMNPRHALATGRVTETRGADAVLRIVSRIKRIERVPADALAVPVSSAGADRVPVRLGRMSDEQRAKLEGFLDRRLGALVEVIGGESFARFVVNRGTADGSRWDIADHTGAGAVQSFQSTDLDVVTRGLEEFLVRSRNASELLAFENLFSELRVEVDVFRPQDSETRPLGESVIQVIADTSTPRYRIRRREEPRTPENSLQLAIRVEQPSYITVVDVDAEGNVNVLFPNAFQDPSFYPDGFVPGGESAVIPDSLDDANLAGFHLDYAPPAGLDTVRVFAAADLETASRIREFARQISGELDAIETIASVQREEEVFTRSVEPPISFQEARQSLLRPRGIIVVPLSDDEPEIVDTTLSVPPEFFDTGGEVPVTSDPAFESPLAPPLEPDPSAATEFSDQLAGAPPVPGDWTAVSLPILVEE